MVFWMQSPEMANHVVGAILADIKRLLDTICTMFTSLASGVVQNGLFAD